MAFGPGDPEPYIERGLAGFNFPRGDVADLLPPKARKRFLLLKQRAEDKRALVAPYYEQIADLRAEKAEHDARVRRLTVARGAGGPGLQADDVQVVDAEGKAKRCADEIARLAELIEVRSAHATRAAHLVQRVEGRLGEGRPAGTRMVDLADFSAATLLKKGETIPAAIARFENRTREHDADHNRAQSALVPTSESKPLMREQVEALAGVGQPDVSMLVEIGERIRWPQDATRLPVRAVTLMPGEPVVTGFASGELPNALAFMVWLNKDAIIKRLAEEIDEISDDAAALSKEQREIRLAEIAADKRQTERNLAAVVWAAIEDGLNVEFPADIDPQALLGIELEVDAAQAAGKPWGMAAAAGHVIEVIG
ncbi:hypothetical protein WHZ78_16655 [Bradyrhizobium symbiodeficiens]|uniref:hypothetical protein n=1 Tax=Bradyrhizobium symbiodeficiens TaxID=1404367 RepID=UPI0030CCA2BA